MSAPPRRRFDPDALAVAQEERDFLLRSLGDLEDERAVGDLAEDDYEQLKDDYTRRAAEAIRAIEGQEAYFKTPRRIHWRQAAVWLVGLAVLGGLSGAAIARSSGTRSGNESFSGGVRASVVSRLSEAGRLLGDQEQWDEAIALYDSVLEEEPSSSEAITYKSWLQYRQGESPEGPLAGFEEVARLDPEYADAVVFHTIVLADAERYGEAAEVLDRLDLDTAPASVAGLLEQRGLAGEVYGEAVLGLLSASEAPTLAQLNLTTTAALSAAGYLLSSDAQDGTVGALKLYGAVQEVEPDNPAALSRQAMLLALTGDVQLLQRAQDLVNQAVEANPDDPEALLSRVTISLLGANDVAQTCADLDRLLGLEGVSEQLVAQAQSLSNTNC